MGRKSGLGITAIYKQAELQAVIDSPKSETPIREQAQPVLRGHLYNANRGTPGHMDYRSIHGRQDTTPLRIRSPAAATSGTAVAEYVSSSRTRTVRYPQLYEPSR